MQFISENDMQAKYEFRVNNKKLALRLCVMGIMSLGLFVIGLIPILSIVKLAFQSDLLKHIDVELQITGVILGILMSVIFLSSSIFLVIKVFIASCLFSTTIVVMDSGVEIVSKGVRCFIHPSDILHILRCMSLSGLKIITLIWKSQDTLVTFNVDKNGFDAEAIEELDGLLKRFEGYTNDYEQTRQIRKNLKLNNIFRKNRFEYQLRNLPKLEPAEKDKK